MQHRKKRLTGALLGAFLTVTAVALAWFSVGLVEGEGETKTGKAAATNIPVKVVATEGVTPTVKKPVTLTVENTVPGSIEFKVLKQTTTITTSNEAACPKANFSVTTAAAGFEREVVEGKEETPQAYIVPANTNYNPTPGMELAMSASAPTGCESVGVKLKVVDTHP